MTGPAAGTAGSPRHVRAAIDCGSNSVHLLVGIVDEHRVRPLADESSFLGLGAAAATGSFGPATRDRLVASIVGYLGVAHGLGATNVVVVGTEPFRRAADAGKAVEEIAAATGAGLEIVEHEEEAFLNLVGVNGGRRVDRETLVCDVGGGSTDLALVGPDEQAIAFGLRLGSARLTDEVVRHDPPTAAELRALRARAEEALASAPAARAERVIGVGGSATNLLRVLPLAGLDQVLTTARLEEILEILATDPAAIAAEQHGVNPLRARMLPAGAAMFAAVLERYGHDQLEVSDLGMREGILLAVDRAGRRWRARLPALANGWGPPLKD
jgi:exopolyphosphatase/guanosine-5'-triphosphate,3'-diphosphate pyrophosphatase